jgi:DNA primase
MARIPENELERLKNEVSVECLVEASGIALKKSGKDLLGQCPFHDDGEPSLVVTPAKNLWHCFGCGIGGNPIDWVMKAQGISFRHAVELLREGMATGNNPSLAANGDKTAKPAKRSTVPKLPAPFALDADDPQGRGSAAGGQEPVAAGQALLNQVIGYYHDTLKASPEAYAYLESRGFAGEPLALAIDTFKLGYANRTLGLRLPEKNRAAGNAIRTRLQDIGIVRASGHEHFNGSLVIPVFDESGDVVEAYGRKIRDDLRKGTPKHLYLPGQHRGLWNLNALVESKEIILCEALVDALTFWCAGYKNVTSCYGIEGFTDEMPELFKRHNIDRILIAFDRDEAGERGTAKVAEKLMAIGIECFRIRFPSGMDANSFVLSEGKAASQSLGKLIRGAHWLGQGKVPSLSETVAENALVSGNTSDNQRPAAKEDEDLTSLAAGISAETLTANVLQPNPNPLPASPMPELTTELPIEVRNNEIWLTLGDGNQPRRYRVRGLAKNLSVEVMKVNLLVSVGADNGADALQGWSSAAGGQESVAAFYVDTLDLYAAKQRSHYIAQAAQETRLDERLLKSDLGRVLLALEQCQDDNIAKALQPEPVPEMPEVERAAALELLKSPDLIARILADFAACGLVGENTNKLVGYLAAISRKLPQPLGIVIQSSSAAGKTRLMDAVLAFVPDADKAKYSAMTGQSLYYMGATNLKHKVLAIVEEEGASRASYALKLLQSEGELTIASTGKDPVSGNLTTQAYTVEGPVALLLTTTARDLDEELMNRCLVLSVDEGRRQTRAIHQLQRDKRTLDGLMAKHHKDTITRLHQNAQMLLKPLDVLNPYAQFLTFPDQTTRLRRDHEKYLTLIDTIAYLHQHQRTVKTARNPGNTAILNPGKNDNPNNGETVIEYIEATLSDIELANRIAHDVLGRSLDELPPQTRRLLKLVNGYINSECQCLGVRRMDFRFSRRQLREAIHWGDTQLKVHLSRLAELEYLVVHRTKTNGFEYELVYDQITDDQPLQFPGLADIATLKHAYDAWRSGQTPAQSASGQGVVGTQSGVGRDNENAVKPTVMRDSAAADENPAKTLSSWQTVKTPSYPNHTVIAAADLQGRSSAARGQEPVAADGN